MAYVRVHLPQRARLPGKMLIPSANMHRFAIWHRQGGFHMSYDLPSRKQEKPSGDAQKLEDIVRRHRALKEKEIRNNAEHERAKKDLKAYLKEIEEKFGVRTIDDLRQIYVDSQKKNQEEMERFSAVLEEKEKQLAEIGEEE